MIAVPRRSDDDQELSRWHDYMVSIAKSANERGIERCAITYARIAGTQAAKDGRAANPFTARAETQLAVAWEKGRTDELARRAPAPIRAYRDDD